MRCETVPLRSPFVILFSPREKFDSALWGLDVIPELYEPVLACPIAVPGLERFPYEFSRGVGPTLLANELPEVIRDEADGIRELPENDDGFEGFRAPAWTVDRILEVIGLVVGCAAYFGWIGSPALSASVLRFAGGSGTTRVSF